MIDTHAHLDDEKYAEDIDEVVARARAAGVSRIFVPSVSLENAPAVLSLCQRYAGYAYPMIGLHPEEVRADYVEVLDRMEQLLKEHAGEVIAIGEVGLDFYYSREFEAEQMLAFERQIDWSIRYGLPLNLHIRKAQNEAVALLRKYAGRLRGGVFHCFTGSAAEARQLLSFEGFALGIGGVLTFKKCGLPEALREAVPMNRLVLETDAPYLAPTPLRGQRNESAYMAHTLAFLADVYHVGVDEMERQTSATAAQIYLTDTN